MPELKFRNLNVTPDDPVEQWGVEGILTAIDRGSMKHWKRIIAAVTADPDGEVAKDLAQAIELAEDVGVAALMRRLLERGSGAAG
ncbi:hypothetical protein [Mycolicibacterium phocaicum]|uniref:hypothetical protein n=1 Tax=Mycolicibacterium phocaicum TaxID=319706 RepID=UPI00138D1EC6|nr:hypothetical protein [Mycolicibacterium phocaicum]BBZ55218.1 hypothetical protein MPHO_22100 [Mycolicibacterium phocaicum]